MTHFDLHKKLASLLVVIIEYSENALPSVISLSSVSWICYAKRKSAFMFIPNPGKVENTCWLKMLRSVEKMLQRMCK